MDRFISDLHLGDLKHVKKRGFKSKKQMHNHIIKEWNSVVTSEDRVFILGDVAIKPKYYEVLEYLNGKELIVILGNHDIPEFIPELLQYVSGVAGLYKYIDGIYLSHAPVNKCQIGTKISLNIHGHMHKEFVKSYTWNYETKTENEIPNSNFCNVCVDMIGYKPKTLNELLK